MKRSVMAWLLTAMLLIALTGYAGAETRAGKNSPGREYPRKRLRGRLISTIFS